MAGNRVVVIGAGVGGLAAAAVLARQGFAVDMLEAQVYPGGCASTFFHQGYWLDSGATLAGGFYPGGPMDLLAKAAGVDAWPVRVEPGEIMSVHLPGQPAIPVTGGPQRWEQRRLAFGPEAEPFWRWQEETAEAVWDLALRLPPWPLHAAADLAQLLPIAGHWLTETGRLQQVPSLARDALRPLAARWPEISGTLRQFIDAQLLISAQTTSANANALYSASALDLSRRGVGHLQGGMGAIASRLVRAIQENGGRVHFRQAAASIRFEGGRPTAVLTKRGTQFPVDQLIANLTPWNIRPLLDESAPASLRQRLAKLPGSPHGWGAFVVYLGVDSAVFPAGSGLHHQVVQAFPLGEGNSVFLSASPEWDQQRAPAGRRAITLSTHTRLEPWWQLRAGDRAAYDQRKQAFTEKVLAAAEVAVPGLRAAADLILPGTPVTFQRFTRRAAGWVGGFPQTSLLRAWSPGLSRGLWMVGDSIFPGQSTAAVALGGLRVAGMIARQRAEKTFFWNKKEGQTGSFSRPYNEAGMDAPVSD